MKLLQEANLDDRVRTTLTKVHDAIEMLDRLSAEFGHDSWPVESQIDSLETASRDLADLAKKYAKIRKGRLG